MADAAPRPDRPRIAPLGEAALLVRFAEMLDPRANRAAQAFHAALSDDPVPGQRECAPGLGSVVVRLDPDAAEVEAAEAELSRRLAVRDWSAAPRPSARAWVVPCAFGGAEGPQLEEAAEMAGLSPSDAVAALCAAPVRVLALGFAPGMPYCGLLPDAWDLPRQTGLTPRVPEGALVTAVRQLIVFGTEAPTGWRQVGLTRFGCFRPARARPIALRAGDSVRFRAVSRDELDAGAAQDAEGLGGATWSATSGGTVR